METWKPIVGYEGFYEVSDAGRIRRIAPWCDGRKTVPKEMTIKPKQSGYCRAILHKDRVHKEFAVHRLVMASFVGPLPSIRHQVNHINGVRSDNRLENLEYLTPSENRLHGCNILGNKPSQVGESHHLSKLTSAKVSQIRKRYGAGEKQKDLAAEFGISGATISEVCARKLWRHVP